MTRIVAFIAQTPGSAIIEEQQACLEPGDLQVLAGRRTFGQLEDLLAIKGIRLGKGDRVKVHDLSCLDIATPMLVRTVVKLLKRGVTFEVCTPTIVVDPSGSDKVLVMLEALDAHYRHMHGIKTHPREMAQAGRKRLLDPNKLAEIRSKLNQPGATQAEVALSLGVSRSTLFNYLEKYDVERQADRPRRKPSNEGAD